MDPIWLESLINGGKALYNHYSKTEEKVVQEEEESPIDRDFNQYFPGNPVSGKPVLKYGYLPPQNPRIPLTSSDEDYDIPLEYGHDKTDYFPQDPQYVPAIKFDHPNTHEGYEGYLPDTPIQPVPELVNHNVYGGQPGKPIAEDGFIPLFLPDKSDPTKQRQPVNSVAFPELDVKKLPPEGYSLPLYPKSPALDFRPQPSSEYPLVYRKPPQQLPEVDIPIVYGQEKPIVYPAVPEAVPPKYPEKPLRRPTKSPPTTTEPVKLVNAEETPGDYYYAYEEEEIPTYAPPVTSNAVEELFESLGINQSPDHVTTTEESSTERKVPTLKVEEILPPNDAPKIEADVEVTHRGSDVVPTTEAASEAPPFEQVEPSEEQKVVYEYEYYYEYYDENNKKKVVPVEAPETTTEAEKTTSTTSSSAFSLQNFLSLISGGPEEPERTTEKAADLEVTIPKKPLLPMRPTLAPPIR